MRQQNPYYKKPVQTDPYLQQKIMSASPEQLIAYVYDAGLAACMRHEREKASKAVLTLIKALDFNQKEIAVTFYNVYRYLNRLISKGKFDEAKAIFADLKKTWSKDSYHC